MIMKTISVDGQVHYDGVFVMTSILNGMSIALLPPAT